VYIRYLFILTIEKIIRKIHPYGWKNEPMLTIYSRSASTHSSLSYIEVICKRKLLWKIKAVYFLLEGGAL